MITIPLNHEKMAIIDDVDSGKVANFKWLAVRYNNTWYAKAYTRVGRVGRINGINRLGKMIYLHRLVMGFPKKFIDHIDHDGLNCRKNNLREVTASQSNMNMRMRKGNVSGFRGVTILRDHPRKRPWLAQLKINGETVFRDYFTTAIAGAKAYNKASLKYHGDFGYRNLIPTK